MSYRLFSQAGGSLEMFMSEDQKKYYNAMKKLGSKAILRSQSLNLKVTVSIYTATQSPPTLVALQTDWQLLLLDARSKVSHLASLI